MVTPTPPGWPAAVRPPGAPDWERDAVAWLLDQCPPEYRGHEVLRRHPAALAWLAGHHVAAAQSASAVAVSRLRGDLAGVLEPRPLGEVMEVLEREQVRLLAARRAVALVEQALRGERYVPRL